MPGYDINRFVDLSPKQAEHLICCICLNIFENAVNSDCRHSFCRQCIQQWIDGNHKECPKCKEVFASSKGPKRKSGVEVILIGSYDFRPDFTANGMINDLKVICDFEYNGCQEVIEFGSLSNHIKQCKHRYCKTCELAADPKGRHNCIQLMKSAINELKLKYQTSEQKVNYLTQKLENVISENVVQKQNEFNNYFKPNDGLFLSVNFLLIGNYKTYIKYLQINSVGIKALYVKANGTQFSYHITIPFVDMQELMFCSDASLPVLLIKPNFDSCHKIQESLYLGHNSPNGLKLSEIGNGL